MVLPARIAAGDGPPSWLLGMMRFLSFRDRAALLQINKSWATISNFKAWWYWQCKFAADQFKLYCPESLPRDEHWETYFDELWSMRDMWRGVVSKSPKDSHRVVVFARIKPETLARSDLEQTDEGGEERPEDCVMLPLHQRVSLIKASSKRPLTSAEAMQILVKQGDWFAGNASGGDVLRVDGGVEQPIEQPIQSPVEQSADAAHEATEEDAEARPQRFHFKIHTVNEASGEIVMSAPNIGLRDFQFNGVINERAEQEDVYERVGRKLVLDAMNGWNGTLFVYGQTGSGKTYTMFGPDDAAATGLDPVRMGLVPRVCSDLLAALEYRRATQGVEASLNASYIEIYGDAVYDLLRNGRPVGHSKVSAQRFVLKGEAQVPVLSAQDMAALLVRGEENKSRAATKMNDRSTRAHSLLVLSIRQRLPSSGAEVESLLFLADLGGSERLGKSQVSGAQLVEATNINLGLLALKQVITSLNEGRRHIPYQNSKLTLLLSAGLGGASRTRVIVCASQDSAHAAETLQTLRFGEECSLVKTRRSNNVSLVVSMVKQLDAQIEALEEAIRQKERWETVEIRRQDEHIESGTFEETLASKGGEMVRTTRLVGAEAEHRQLQHLHERRRQLLGQA